MTYFVQIGHDGPIKIGNSSDVPGRLRALQTGVPWVLHLLLVLDNVPDYEIYHQFSASRLRGEWFYPTAELLAYIAKQKKLPHPNRDSWAASRAKRGTNPTFVRPIMDYCLIEAR